MNRATAAYFGIAFSNPSYIRSHRSRIILGTVVLTALISGIVYFKFSSIMGAHALNIALWGIWSAIAINFITR